MTSNDMTPPTSTETRVAAALLGAWGLYQMIAGLYFIFIRPGLLPEDLRAAATTLGAVHAAAPRLEAWLDWVFAVMGGQMAASGVLLLGATVGVYRGRRPDRIAIAAYGVAGLLSVTLMSGVNFALGSEFRWFLVMPVILWLTAMIFLGRQAFGDASQN